MAEFPRFTPTRKVQPPKVLTHRTNAHREPTAEKVKGKHADRLRPVMHHLAASLAQFAYRMRITPPTRTRNAHRPHRSDRVPKITTEPYTGSHDSTAATATRTRSTSTRGEGYASAAALFATMILPIDRAMTPPVCRRRYPTRWSLCIVGPGKPPDPGKPLHV